ncbi:MAG: efflux RND transporter permease subunit [Clostridia bacterium]
MFANFSVKKPLTVFVSVLMVIILGVVSFTNMTPDLLPSINMPYILVTTVYAGATPEEVEEEITMPMESSMATLEGIDSITSTSSENVSMIILAFTDDTNMDTMVSDIREEINLISDDWSEMVSTPYIMEINPDIMPVTISAVNYSGMDSLELTDFVENELINQLEGTDGVASIDTMGSITQQIDVIISQEKIDEINALLTASILAEFDEVEQELLDAETELNDGLDELTEQEQALSDAEDELLAGQEELVDQTATAQSELISQQIYLLETKADLAEQLELAQEGLVVLEESYTMLNELLTQYNELVSQKSSLETAVDALGQIEEAYPTLVAAKTELETQIAFLESLNDDANAETIATLNAQLVEIETQIMVIETQLSAMGATSEQISVMKEQYQANLDLINQALDTIISSLEEYGITADNFAETVAELGAQVTELEAGIVMLEEAIAGIESGTTTVTEALETINKAQINGSLEISEGYSQIITGQSAITSAIAQLEAAQTEIDTAKEEIESAKETTLDSSTMEITMDMINQLLVAQNFSMPAGYITEDNVSYLIRVGDEVEDFDELVSLPLMYLDIDGIGLITLSDVADVYVNDNSAETYTTLDGEDGMILSFTKQSTYATATVSENIAEVFEELEEKYDGLSFVNLTDQGDYIDLIVNNVLQNLAFGAILAVLILLLFLKDIKPTIIIAFSIPISLMFAIVLMYFSGVTLNIISLSGLAVGVGMLVDNSVVVIENIYRMRAEGVDKFKAAARGANQVAGAIFSSTLTTICVFLPIVFIDGITRELFTDMALTIGYSLGASLIVALTLVPAMASKMLKEQKPKKDIIFGKIISAYEKVLAASLKRKYIVLILSVVLLIASTWVTLAKGFIFMPSMSGTQISITVTPNDEEITFEEQTELADEIYSRISGIEEIQSIGIMVEDGSSSTSMYTTSGITMYAIMYDDASRKDSAVCEDIESLCTDLECEVSATGSMDMTSMLSALSGSGVTVQIYGNDLDDLMQEAELLAAELEKVEGLTEITTGLEESDPEISIVVDKEKAAESSLTVAQVYMYIASAITTETASTSITYDDTTKDITIYDDPDNIMTITDLEAYEIEYTDTYGETQTVKLTDIATIEETQSLNSISRENQKRTLTVSATIADDYNVTLVTNEAETVLENYEPIDGNTIEIGGESETIMEAIIQLVYMLLLAVVIIYFIMVAQFQSLKLPFIVMFTIPLAFTGGFIALLVAGMELSVISMIGFVMLAGIIVNNGIVLIDYINILRLDGMDKTQAIIQAGKTRIRPILMTALTTILGLLFMALGTGVGTELMQPIAIVCIGGLTYATLMTLFVIPAMYDILSRKKMEKIELD